MPKFEDPITGTEYRPISDPTGTLMQSVGAVVGITMTLVLLGVAQSQLLPVVSNALSDLAGINTGSGDGIVQFGDQ